MSADPIDCLIVGAGPAGLTAATYLARFHRRIAVVDAGQSRARWIPTSRNFPGYPSGIGGDALLAKMREQAEGYGASTTRSRVTALRRDGDVFIAGDDHGRQWRASYALLATGIVDRMPQMDRLEDAIAAGTVRLCAVCDGYEASDERIAVLAPADVAIQHALFLRTFSRSVTAIRSEPGEPTPLNAKLAEAAKVALLPVTVGLESGDGHCDAILDGGGRHRFDTLYPVLGCNAQAALASAVGAATDENGELKVDAAMQTSVDRLYAIGDVVSALNQISVAVGHAAIAATAIHNRLPPNYREDVSSQSVTAAMTPAPDEAAVQ